MPYLDQTWLDEVAKHTSKHEKTLLDDLLVLREKISDARAERHPPVEVLYQEAAPSFRKRWRTLQNMVLTLREYSEAALRRWIVDKQLAFEALHRVNQYYSWGLLQESPDAFLNRVLIDPMTVDEIDGIIFSVQKVMPREFLDRSYAFRFAKRINIPKTQHEEFVKQLLELVKSFRKSIDGLDIDE